MRRKLLLLSIFAVFATALSAQPLNWTESLYNEELTSVIEKETSEFTEGISSMKYTFTDDGVPYFICDTFLVTENSPFTCSIDYLDNDPAGEITIRVFFFEEDGTYISRFTSDGTVDSPDWQTISVSETSPAGAAKAYMVIRMLTGPDWAGEATFWADNAIYSESSGPNLIVNGGFEQWYIAPGSTVLNWVESLYTPSLTSTIVPETEEVSDGYVALNYTFTDDGVPYFICDTFTVSESAPFTCSIDYLDNDPAGEITIRVFFFEQDGTYISRFTSNGTVDSPDWQTISVSETSPAGAAKAYMVIRMLTGSGWAGQASFLADHAIYSEDGGPNLIVNGSFEHWQAPSNLPGFTSYSFEGLDPAVNGVIDEMEHTVTATVPFETDLTTLVATFELTEGTTAKVGAVDQESGVTANDFSSPLTYTLTAEDGETTQDWVVTVEKDAAETGNSILSFRFEDLDPPVNGIVTPADHTVAAEVPNGTDVTTLVPTIVLSSKATSLPEGGVATDFSNPVTYTVTAQDGSTQDWVVTVSVAAAGKTVLFSEDFEGITKIPEDWVIINADGYTQASGEERWQDSAWLVTTTSRIELTGTQVAMASSYTSDMPLDGRAYDWMILPSITLGSNTTLSWQAMSTTSSGNYPDDYLVLIAPAVSGISPTVTYFEEEGNILIEVEPESWSANVGRPGQGVSSYAINLKEKVTPSAADGWYDRDVWIAFVLNTDLYTPPETGVPNSTAGGSNLAVDNIQLVNDSGTGLEEEKGSQAGISIYPNPARETVKLSFYNAKAGLASITVHDILGKMVYQVQEQLSAGTAELELQLSELKDGIYFVKTEINGLSQVSKLIVE